MLLLYRFALNCYQIILRIYYPFYPKARAFLDGRKGLLEELGKPLQTDKKVIWIHAASVGEFEQGRPIIEAIRKEKMDVFILLTFYSPSGYELRRNYELADLVTYLPIDSPTTARQFLEITNPSLAIFIKYEFWYFYLKELQRLAVPTLYVSCILRSNHFMLTPYGKFFQKILRGVQHYFVQDQKTKELLHGIRVDQVTVAGDTRFDRVSEIARKAADIPEVESFINGEELMIIGSAWKSDLDVFLPLISEMQDKLKFIIAPHNIDEQHLKPFVELPGAIRYSELEDSAKGYRLLIIDNVGMLSRLYKYARYSLVGGAFNGTLHNVLEPAVYGIPVFFGRHQNNAKFLEAQGLIDAGGGFCFGDIAELRNVFMSLFENERLYQQAAQASGDFVRSGTGATVAVIEEIKALI